MPLKYRPSMRPFGVEIEITIPYYDRPERTWADSTWHYKTPHAKGKLEKEFHDWDMGYDCCAELRSPVLTGADGMHRLEKMYTRLIELGAKANRCCGAHTHYNADDLTKEDLARIANAWANNEDLINSFVDESRWRNGMCSPVKGRTFTKDQLPFKGQSINCTSHHGTIEIRKHHATTDFEEMEAWIRFCQAFIHSAVTQDEMLTCANDEEHLLARIKPVKVAHERLLKKL